MPREARRAERRAAMRGWWLRRSFVTALVRGAGPAAAVGGKRSIAARVANPGEDVVAGFGVELLVEQAVGALDVGVELRHAAVRIGEVAEHDRLGRARGLARGDDV